MVGRIERRVARQLRPLGTEVQAGQGLGQRQVGKQPGFAEQQIQATIGQHVGQALGGVLGVQRHIGRAALEHGQQADDQLRTTATRQAHALAGSNAKLQQTMSQTVGSRVELCVAQLFVSRLHGQCVGGAGGLGGDAFMHARAALGSGS